LCDLIDQELFREDLFNRIPHQINLPSWDQQGLENRTLIVIRQLNLISLQSSMDINADDKVLECAACLPLPGGVRELQGILERACDRAESAGSAITLKRSDVIYGMTHAPDRNGRVASTATESSLAAMTRDFQIDYIRRTIDAHDGNMPKAAQALGLHRSNLYRKMRRLAMKGAEELEE
jgi:transcriptional regulator with PAS, ATPase and Fis domain